MLFVVMYNMPTLNKIYLLLLTYLPTLNGMKVSQGHHSLQLTFLVHYLYYQIILQIFKRKKRKRSDSVL